MCKARTPLLYPSGSTVVVQIHRHGDRFLVSDMGMGYQEADLMGMTLLFVRNANVVAERTGVKFDQHSFFVVDATKEQLVGATVAVANCSQEAVQIAAYKLAEKKAGEAKDRLYERLLTVFSPQRVSRDYEILGASRTPWHVAAIVRTDSKKTLFEPVANSHPSVVNAAAKFHDIALLVGAPARIAVVRNRSSFGTWLGVLSQAANVVEERVSNRTFERLAA